MIYEVKMFSGKCDACGEEWVDEHNGYVAFTDKSSMRENMMNDEWHREGDKDYCPNCYKLDEETDEYIYGANIRKQPQP